MLNKNKIARITLALFMTLNISTIKTSITEATPADSSYYNPYSHGETYEKSKTFGANEESNSERKEREKKEAEEAKRKADEAKKAEEAKKANEATNLNNANANSSLPDASKKGQKANAMLINDDGGDKEKTNLEGQKNSVNPKDYLGIARQECEKAYSQNKEKLLKDNGARISGPSDICSDERIEELAYCLAAYSSEGENPSNVSQEVIDSCVNNYILVSQSSKAITEEPGIFDRIKEAVASIPTTLAEKGYISDDLAKFLAEEIRNISAMDIIEEIGITAGLALLTMASGGVAGVALVGRGAQILNKLRKVANSANKFKSVAKEIKEAESVAKGVKNVREKAKEAKAISNQLSKVKGDYIKKAEKVSGEKFNTYEDAYKSMRKKSSLDNSFKASERASMKKLGKQIEELENKKIFDGGKTFKEINAEKTKISNELADATKKLNEGKQNVANIENKLNEVKNNIGTTKNYNNAHLKKLEKDLTKANNEVKKLTTNKQKADEAFSEFIKNNGNIEQKIDASVVRKGLEKVGSINKFTRNPIKTVAGASVVSTTGIETYRYYNVKSENQKDGEVYQKTAEIYEQEAINPNNTIDERKRANNKANELKQKAIKNGYVDKITPSVTNPNSLDEFTQSTNSQLNNDFKDRRADIDNRTKKMN